MINLFYLITQSKKTIEYLLIVLLISFPFGASLIKASIGFMTLYPYLICLLLLTFIGLFHLKSIKSPIEKYIIFFFLFWLIYAAIQFTFIDDRENGIIDMRSIILFLIQVFNIIWIKSFLGINRTFKTMAFCFKSIFLIMVIFSVFEVYTGIHFYGDFTQKLESLPISSLMYSPVFLFDNPNNLVTYIILIGSLIILTDQKIKKKPFLIWSIYFSCFFISYVTSARMAQMLMISVGGIYLLYNAYLLWFENKMSKKYVYVFLVLTSVLLLHYFMLPKYYGPIWSTVDNAGIIKTIEPKPESKSKCINNPVLYTNITNFNEDTLDNYYSSTAVRLALIYNGLEITRSTNFLGAGPGQIRSKHRDKEVLYYTKTNVSPHNGFIEILSQYGIIILTGFGFIFLWMFIKCLSLFKQHKFYVSTVIISALLFMGASVFPSGFLILNINWIFLPVLIISVSSFNKKAC